MTDMTNLTDRQIKAAFENSGYSDVEFTHQRFIKMTDKGWAVYAVSFENEDGQDDSGYLYIQKRGEELYGEF